MKIPVGISLPVLAIVVGIGWMDHCRLNGLIEVHEQLAAKAASLRIPADSARITKRFRENPEIVAKRVAAEFIRSRKDSDAIKQGAPGSERPLQTSVTLLDSLDAGQMKIVIVEILSDPDLDNKTRKDLIGLAISRLVSRDPKGALARFNEASDLIKDTSRGRDIVTSSLGAWSADDPVAALGWVRNYGANFPDAIHYARATMINGAATKSPESAFELLRGLGENTDREDLVSNIIANAPPEMRTATLAALRKHLGTIDDDKDLDMMSRRSFGALGDEIARDGFEAGRRWIEEAGITPVEISGMIESLVRRSRISDQTAEKGSWIEWASGVLPETDRDEKTRRIVMSWTGDDFLAAGKWLNTVPDGHLKNISTKTYAEEISRHDPESAVRWAMTLPPGKARDGTLVRIYHYWPKNDPASKAAAAAFATEHGIK
jgi:hypothetical protein